MRPPGKAISPGFARKCAALRMSTNDTAESLPRSSLGTSVMSTAAPAAPAATGTR